MRKERGREKGGMEGEGEGRGSSMTMVSKTLCSHFSCKGSYYGYTHAWTKLHNGVIG